MIKSTAIYALSKQEFWAEKNREKLQNDHFHVMLKWLKKIKVWI